jgi:hypothetical protein
MIAKLMSLLAIWDTQYSTAAEELLGENIFRPRLPDEVLHEINNIDQNSLKIYTLSLLLRASLAATEFLTEFLVSPKLPRVFL